MCVCVCVCVLVNVLFDVVTFSHFRGAMETSHCFIIRTQILVLTLIQGSRVKRLE